MREQLYSPMSLRRAWDARVRRGENLQTLYPELEPINNELRQAKRKLREELRRYPQDPMEREQIRARHEPDIERLQAAYEATLQDNLEATSREVQSRLQAGNLRVELSKKPPLVNDANQRPLYALKDRSAAGYFLSRQIEYEIRSVADTRPADRNLMSHQLRIGLEKPANKAVFRTDVKGFYESIHHQNVLEMFQTQYRISKTSYNYIEALLKSYQSQAGTTAGLPRGMAISARIAEAYMNQLDTKIKAFPGIVMYLRYVDDIVTVANLERTLPNAMDHALLIKEVIESIGLTVNEAKTQLVETPGPKVAFNNSIEFLGYKYHLAKGKVSVDISEKRFERYKRRIDISFDTYASRPDARAFQMLHDRLKYLTSNTRLSNNRRQALIGVYFSNSALVHCSEGIDLLDAHLMHQINSYISDIHLRNQLLKYSFTDGFSSKRFFKVSPRRISQIVRVWKHVS